MKYVSTPADGDARRRAPAPDTRDRGESVSWEQLGDAYGAQDAPYMRARPSEADSTSAATTTRRGRRRRGDDARTAKEGGR